LLCSNCGIEISNKVNFCPECGSPLTTRDFAQKESLQGPENKKPKSIIENTLESASGLNEAQENTTAFPDGFSIRDFLTFKIQYQNLEYINNQDLAWYNCPLGDGPLVDDPSETASIGHGTKECVQCSNNIIGHAYRCNSGCLEFMDFCSIECVAQHERERHCSVCKAILPQKIIQCKNCSASYKFCGEACYKQHKHLDHCAYCGEVLGRTYSACRRCGSESPRYCNNYCFRHHYH
jgi:hypothetical protein